MKEANELCECLSKLELIGTVAPYVKEAESYYFSKKIDDGTICLVFYSISDNGYYENDSWVSNFEIGKDYYPISYCPICGREITYKKEMIRKMEK